MYIDEFGGEQYLTGEILKSSKVEQPFTAKKSFLKSISMCFATYRRRNYCAVLLFIYDSKNNLVTRKTIKALSLLDNSFFQFDINLELEKNEKYKLVVVSKNSRPGNAVTCKWGSAQHNNHNVIINGVESYGELACSFVYGNKIETPVRKVVLPTSPDMLCGLVSIVIPAYECSEYIKECLKRLSFQTYTCFEVVIVDDGSSDVESLEEVIFDVENNFNFPIEFRKHNTNKGANAARNTGYYYTRGEYLFFLDADCFLVPNALQQFISKLSQNPKADYAYCNYKRGGKLCSFEPFDPVILKRRNYASTMSMIRRKSFPGFDEVQQRLQDWDLWLTMLSNGSEGVWINEVLFETPQRDDGITFGNKISFPEAYWKVRNKDKFWSNETARNDVSALMVVYKTKDLFERAYGSFRNFYPNMKLVIVDGSGGDDCTDYVKSTEQKDGNMIGVYYDYNIGHGQGMHIGITHIRTPFIYVFDSDTEMVKGGVVEAMFSCVVGETYGVGDIQKVNDVGSNVSVEGLPYLHPAVILLNRASYVAHKPFRHHGAPCIDAMRDIFYSGKSNKMLIQFPVADYVIHDLRGTRERFGLKWNTR